MDILMSADLFAGDAQMEGNDMAGAPGGPNRWLSAGPDAAFQGQPMHQQVGRHAYIIIIMQLQSYNYHCNTALGACRLHYLGSLRGPVLSVIPSLLKGSWCTR